MNLRRSLRIRLWSAVASHRLPRGVGMAARPVFTPSKSAASCRTPNRPGTRAFTLIEVLLAVTIFGIVLVALQGIFHGALRLRNRTVESIENALPLEQALTIIRRDLAGIVPPGGTLGGSVQTTPVIDGMNGQPTIEFHTAVGILSDRVPWSEVRRVAYLLTAPTNGSAGRVLHRAVTHNLLPVNQATLEDQTLIGGVDSVHFSFYDGSTWRDTWNSTNETVPLPRAIRFELLLLSTNLNRGNITPRPIEMVVNILVEPSTNSTSQSTGGGS